MVTNVDPTFFIKSVDSGFTHRQKNIFDQINVAEKEKNQRQLVFPAVGDCRFDEDMIEADDTDIEPVIRPRKRRRFETKQFQGKESIFKRPDIPPPRIKPRGIPDYQRNPHKWMKYSLGDVSQEDMSDRANTAAALAFLKEVEERNVEKDTLSHDSGPVVFKMPKIKTSSRCKHTSTYSEKEGMVNAETVTSSRPTSSIVNIADAEDCAIDDRNENSKTLKPSYRNTKLIMPEYVVGQTKKKEVKRKQEMQSNSNIKKMKCEEIKLQHLLEEEVD